MKRPMFLTIWLVLLSAGYLLSFISSLLATFTVGKVLPNLFWVFLLITLVAAFNLIAISLVWRWSKIGFYVLILLIIPSVILNVLNGQVAGGLFGLIFGLIFMGILYLSMRPVWEKYK